MTDDELAAIDKFERSDLFDETEKAVMAYATAMTQTPANVPQQVFDALKHVFNEKQLVELTSVIAWENYRARFDHAFEIGSAGFADPAASPAPSKCR